MIILLYYNIFTLFIMPVTMVGAMIFTWMFPMMHHAVPAQRPTGGAAAEIRSPGAVWLGPLSYGGNTLQR